tara:strand:+ start:120 stop:1967 length:1848 start_codon:yes stop_codon:yes gene_type:complete
MPLKKLVLKPGVNRENTVYTSEGGWYDCDKVRFRQGTPEKIGGWTRVSGATFLGIARSLFSWVTLGGSRYLGIGTNLKFYIESGGAYYDITPERATVTLTNPFTTVSGSTTVTVADSNGGYIDGDFVTFSGGAAVGGITVVGEFQITKTPNANTYTITFTSAASSSATGGGTVTAKYQINTGPETSEPLVGWGASTWGDGVWGTGGTSTDSFRTWSQANFGEDLVFGPRTGPAFFWDQSEDGLTTRAVLLSGISGSTAPIIQNHILVSDINRFVFFLGTNALGTTTIDPMLIRWSDQESALNWTPTSTNQAGDLRLSRGSEIVTGIQARQEVLIWTDTALYTMKYVGAPVVWGAQLVGDNLSIASRNSAIYVNGVSYWMGVGNFYKYDGRVQTLRCDLKKYIFNDLNTEQYAQVFTGLNESFGEIWWFYCSGSSTSVDKYVIYNYDQDIWYFGTLARTAWVDSGVRDFPIASTYTNNLVNHEDGLDNNEGSSVVAIDSYISSAQFDLEDGHQFVFVHKMLPDMSFDGSTADSPSVEMSLLPLQSAGSGFNNPLSEGGVNAASVTRTASVPVEVFTDQINVRVRGRQMAIKVQSTDTGVAWQLGSPRIDMRPDGRR